MRKQVISRNAKIVSFFTRSHYWGGQLAEEADNASLEKSLQMHTDSRRYTLVLQAMSIQEYRYEDPSSYYRFWLKDH